MTKQTVAVLKAWLQEPSQSSDQWIFSTAHGARLSADAVQDLLAKYRAIAGEVCPSLQTKRVTPHLLRHYADLRTMPTGTRWARLLTGLCRFRMGIGRGIVPHGSQAFEECQQSVSWLKEPRSLTALGGLGQDFLL